MEGTWTPDKGEAPDAVGNCYKAKESFVRHLRQIPGRPDRSAAHVQLAQREHSFWWGQPCAGCLQMGCSHASPSFVKDFHESPAIARHCVGILVAENRYNYCHSVGTKSPEEVPCHESSPLVTVTAVRVSAQVYPYRDGTPRVTGYRSEVLAEVMIQESEFIRLAEAVLADKYRWRPAPDVR